MFTRDDWLPERALELGIHVSVAAGDDIAATVAAALAQADRAAYERQPERPDHFWNQAEAWTALGVCHSR